MLNEHVSGIGHAGDSVGTATQQVQTGTQGIISLLKTSGEFFIEFFLGEDLTWSVPLFHKEIWERLTDLNLPKILLAVPRSHAKTTLAKLCVVWYFLFTRFRFCIYVSNTSPIAKNACKDIVEYLKCPNFVAVFGKVDWIKESETEGLWIFDLKQPSGRFKRCILRSAGAGQQMRGINIDNQRPDIAVVDDLEDNENTDSELLQKKLDLWVFGPFLKALAPNPKVIWLGNMLAKTCLLSRLSTDKEWNPVVFGSIVKDETTGELVSLWPDLWSMDKLLKDFQTYAQLGLIETWMCEMMNMPGHGKNGFTVDAIWMEPAPLPDECRAAFLVLDPAFGEQEHNDDSSITVHVIREDGLPMVAEDITGKFEDVELFELMLGLAQKWNAWVWGIEAVAAQRLLISLFNVLAANRRMNHHIEMVPLMSGRGDPKVSRIKSFIGLMKKREYAIYEGAVGFVTQALAYNMTKKNNRDDLLDSCAYGPQMLQMYLPLIMVMASGLGEDALLGKAQFGTEICSV